METSRVQIKPLSPAAEGMYQQCLLLLIIDADFIASMPDDLIDFRLSHPDTLAKQVNRHLYLLDTSYLSEDLQPAATAEIAKRSESLELDVTRYTLALKRARKATEAQKAQQEAYKAQTSALAQKCQERREEIHVERQQLDFAKKKKQMHEECEALAKQLKSRPRKKAELDNLIGELENQIKEQEELIAAYQTESAARLEEFDQVFTALDKVVQVEKVEPGRSTADLPALEEVLASASETTQETSTGSDIGKRLDPKASVFTPTSRPILPGSTAGATSVTKSSSGTSRAGANLRGKDKHGSSAAAGTTNRVTPASMTRTKSSTSVGGKKPTPASGTRSRAAPTSGAASKEANPPRTGGRRQATNIPSQLKTSTINMEDGEISSNDGTPAAAGSPEHVPKVGQTENASGNKRNRQDQDSGDAVKRRRVEESKKDGVTGV
ncbi:hypothetical protein QFC21_001258 [Naganishia friedmannii]|uniref:Uncharacterized protein n=1 Tax=Naganishia friedmannii TaxID=89922 RepID=A0ACC2W3Z1_9TREE|nr:hypothetical protein QFC21_001258 [Naganishia friedmannii]